MTAIHDHSSLLTTREAARRLGLAAGTLANWRTSGQGPAVIRLGRAVRYTEDDLAQFVAQSRNQAMAQELRPAPSHLQTPGGAE